LFENRKNQVGSAIADDGKSGHLKLTASRLVLWDYNKMTEGDVKKVTASFILYHLLYYFNNNTEVVRSGRFWEMSYIS
jgi:hypothetical protein